jgi:gamma-glutamyltranspeptidase
VLLVEPTVDAEARRMLERAGHRVKVIPGIGAVAGAGLDADGVPVAAGDRRKDGGQAVVR